MRTKVLRWGNSLGLRLSKEVATSAGLEEGTEIEVSVVEDSIVLRRTAPQPTLEQLIRAYRPGTEPDPEDVDFGPRQGKEI